MGSKQDMPTFGEVAAFVRKWHRVPAEQQITPDTVCERDLGIRGDDWYGLLEATERHFRVTFIADESGHRGIFSTDTYPLSPELSPPDSVESDMASFLLSMNPAIRGFTVGELWEKIRHSPVND